MRIIAGAWRGRKLLSPKGDLVRPTTDRVKEAMFSILGPSVRGCVVLDLCCGAGGLAIEALSRGARKAILVDTHRKSLDLARRNLKLCGAESHRYALVKSDAEVFYSGWQPPDDETPWILLSDPPYHSSLAASIVQRLTHDDPDAGFVTGIVEHGDGKAFEDTQSGPWKINSRTYGETCLTVIRPG